MVAAVADTGIKPFDPLADREGVQYFHRPAVYSRVPPVARTSNKTPLAANWWSEQLKRCKFGWTCPQTNQYDPPSYYFHNNFMQYKILGEDESTVRDANPYIIDIHRYVFTKFDDCLPKSRVVNGRRFVKPAHGLVFAKGRRAGITTDGWGFTMWHFLFRQDLPVAHLYPDEKTRDRENVQVRRMFAKLHDAFKFDKDRHPLTLVTQNKEVLQIGYYTYSADGTKIKNVVNSWYFGVASGDPGILRGEQFGLIVIVEAGKWTNLKDVIRAQIDCLKIGTSVFGILIVAGTSDMITNDSEDYKEIFFNPEPFNLEAVFLRPTRGRKGFYDLKTGISDESKAEDSILKEYEEAARSSNPQDLLSRQQELPLSPELCFVPPSRNEYDKTKLEQHFMWLLRNVERNKSDYFVWGEFIEESTVGGKSTGNIIFKEVPNGQSVPGLWKLLRSAIHDPELNPNYDNLSEYDEFSIGFDDFYKNKKAHELKSWHSKGALVVMNRRTREIVGSYVHRPTRPELHRQAIMALRFWGTALMNYEYNDDVFYELLEKENMLHRLVYWDDKGWGPKNKGGMYAQGTIEVQTSHMQAAIGRGDYLKWMQIEAISELKKWQSLNTDFGSAHHLANIGLSRLPEARNQKPDNAQTWNPVVVFGTNSMANKGSGPFGFGSTESGNGFYKFGSR